MFSLPVMNFVLRLQKFGLQMSDRHFLLLQGGEVLLWVWRSNAMVLSTGVVAAQAHSSVKTVTGWGGRYGDASVSSHSTIAEKRLLEDSTSPARMLSDTSLPAPGLLGFRTTAEILKCWWSHAVCKALHQSILFTTS